MRRAVIVGLAILLVLLLALHWQFQRRTEMTILVRMIDSQDRWFRGALEEFQQDYNVTIKVLSFDRMDEVRSWLERERDNGIDKIGLVKVQKQMLATLVDEDLILPLDEIVSEGAVTSAMDDYLRMALECARFERKKGSSTITSVHYIPRKLEANTLLYRKSKVADAVQNWGQSRPQVNSMLRQHNGYGLPHGYQLEPDPNEWDWYDLAVVSFYWAHTEYDGSLMPRTAHRGRRYGGTMNEIATKVFQAGGDSRALLFEGDENLEAIYDAFEWEAFYRKNGLYNPAMWEQRWAGSHIWKAMSEDLVFLAFMHQLDAFFIHGNADSGLDGYLEDPDDMAVAIMPQGVSLALDSQGDYVRQGSRNSLKTGWWWGVPSTSPDPKLSYELARHITGKEFHLAEATRFGMLPIRKDVAAELDRLKDDPERRWMGDVFDTARRQFEAGVEELPTLAAWPAIESVWLDAWFEIVVRGNYSPQGPSGRVNRDHIKRVLQGYGRRIRGLAKN